MNNIDDKIRFSVVVPTFNAGECINDLLKYLSHVANKYNIEVICIDSSSTGKTLDILNKYIKKIKNYKIILIKKNEFNHGETRNKGVKLARGEYICFFSQDVVPFQDNMWKKIQNHFSKNNKLAAVFGKQIPKSGTAISEILDTEYYYSFLASYTNKYGLLNQNLSDPFVPYIPQNYSIWWSLSDAFCCYRRKFLLSNPFKKISYGEDYEMGSEIIKNGYEKLFDSTISVYHTHSHTLPEKSLRLLKDFGLKYRISVKNSLAKYIWKIQYIKEKKEVSSLEKAKILCTLHYEYVVKMALYSVNRSLFILKKVFIHG